ncbi:hypothetical protein KAFR_0A07260 [Kazachstania africana CBS 2517]|uniref:Zn(2)-C6 fungal-type domain-containing protein n=1 Tax=Kazachstania africana (strain ATCC 22294 / BCRC 22015 / CBS 2517 / CECT 1963 / NBRC 1671 / NRRL Y-8276) TaxID=1071382 RepID=H2AP60_KAZAF|nr:hypothetical protein KAFR_0A07260 [Kazachstania africana CBS 2517]CCF56160.1 hypothetical protein KAFR_0A07260 [Kazachstania africana CBS 2517]
MTESVRKITRRRTGCRRCKKSKIRCDETKPKCLVCQKKNFADCDYTIDLKWGGRPFRNLEKCKAVALPNTEVRDGVVIIKNGCSESYKPKKSVIRETAQKDISLGIEKVHHEILNRKHRIRSIKKQELSNSIRQIRYIDQRLDPKSSLLNFTDLSPSSTQSVSLKKQYKCHGSFKFFSEESRFLFSATSKSKPIKHSFSDYLLDASFRCSTLLNLALAFASIHESRRLNHESFYLDEQLFTKNQKFTEFSKLSQSPDVKKVLLPSHKMDSISAVPLLDKIREDISGNKISAPHKVASNIILATCETLFSVTYLYWREYLTDISCVVVDLCIDSSIPGSQTDVVLNLLNRYIRCLVVTSMTSYRQIEIKNQCVSFIDNYIKNITTSLDATENQQIDSDLGFDTKILSLTYNLTKLLRLYDREDGLSDEVFRKVVELDYELDAHLGKLEKEHYLHEDEILSATNQIFGLTGSLQTKRRTLYLCNDSKAVDDILLKVTAVIEACIPADSSMLPSILPCLFCCGCELLSDTTKSYRDVYLERLESISKMGVCGAIIAKEIMKRCWQEGRSWWSIEEEYGLDIALII